MIVSTSRALSGLYAFHTKGFSPFDLLCIVTALVLLHLLSVFEAFRQQNKKSAITFSFLLLGDIIFNFISSYSEWSYIVDRGVLFICLVQCNSKRRTCPGDEFFRSIMALWH